MFAIAVAERFQRPPDEPAVERPDRDQVEEVQQEAGVGQRDEETGVRRLARHPDTERADQPRIGPAAETSRFRQGSKGAFLIAT